MMLRVLWPGQEMIGIVQRDEALRMLRGQENLGAIFDADHLVSARMQNQKRLLERSEARELIVVRQIVDKAAAHPERAPADADLSFAVLDQLVDIRKQPAHMGDVGASARDTREAASEFRRDYVPPTAIREYRPRA